MSILKKSTDIVFAGKMNQDGIMRSLKSCGMSLDDCLAEIIANCLDAKSTQILFKIDDKKQFINIIDNGNGMNQEKLIKMFDAYGSNHNEDKCMGISGIGGKASSLILSNQTLVSIITRENNGDYFTSIIPWDKIM